MWETPAAIATSAMMTSCPRRAGLPSPPRRCGSARPMDSLWSTPRRPLLTAPLVRANNVRANTLLPQRARAGHETDATEEGVTSMADQYTVGVDFGTLSGRAVVVRVADGAEVGTAVHEYRHGVIERELPATGELLPPDWALQDPQDYVDVLGDAVPRAVAAAGIDPAQVIGIGTDFTACTVLPTLADGTPLCHIAELAARPHAYAKLWKHH